MNLIYFVAFLNLGLSSVTNGLFLLQPSDVTSVKTNNTSVSIIKSLVGNPNEFISQVASLDPKKLDEIIVLLEKLVTVSEGREKTLFDTLTTKKAANKLAEDNVITAGTNLDTAKTNVANAKIALTDKETKETTAKTTLDTAKSTQKDKKKEQDTAQKAYDDEKPSLDDEQKILRDVIKTLKNLREYPLKVAKLDFGEPGVNEQAGFTKLGVPDIGHFGFHGVYTGTFPCQDSTCTIKVSGYDHTRGNYNALVNRFAYLSNLLRSSFLRNHVGTMRVKINGLEPLTNYEIKTYHHSTQADCSTAFTMQYDGNQVNNLKQSSLGQNPNPPLIHTEVVTTNSHGEISFVMKRLANDSHPLCHMDLNGMEIGGR